MSSLDNSNVEIKSENEMEEDSEMLENLMQVEVQINEFDEDKSNSSEKQFDPQSKVGFIYLFI